MTNEEFNRELELREKRVREKGQDISETALRQLRESGERGLCVCGHLEEVHTVTREEMGGMTIHNQCSQCGCYGYEERRRS